jgi:hypothetical protein
MHAWHHCNPIRLLHTPCNCIAMRKSPQQFKWLVASIVGQQVKFGQHSTYTKEPGFNYRIPKSTMMTGQSTSQRYKMSVNYALYPSWCDLAPTSPHCTWNSHVVGKIGATSTSKMTPKQRFPLPVRRLYTLASKSGSNYFWMFIR